MKKTLTALMLCLISICFVGCSDKNAPNDPTLQTNQTEKTETSNDLNTQKSNCLINISAEASISYTELKSLIIKDEDGKTVGTGNYWGSYYVPYDGTLTINWNHRYSSYRDWTNSEYTFNVGSAHQLDVKIIHENHYEYIEIGGSRIESFENTDW